MCSILSYLFGTMCELTRDAQLQCTMEYVVA